MTVILMNLGTGPVAQATEAAARSNLDALLRELGAEGATLEPLGGGGDGRWAWRVQLGRRKVEVSIPGCLLETLQAQTLGQPRLYVNGSSWYWHIALGLMREYLDLAASNPGAGVVLDTRNASA